MSRLLQEHFRATFHYIKYHLVQLSSFEFNLIQSNCDVRSDLAAAHNSIFKCHTVASDHIYVIVDTLSLSRQSPLSTRYGAINLFSLPASQVAMRDFLFSFFSTIILLPKP